MYDEEYVEEVKKKTDEQNKCWKTKRRIYGWKGQMREKRGKAKGWDGTSKKKNLKKNFWSYWMGEWGSWEGETKVGREMEQNDFSEDGKNKKTEICWIFGSAEKEAKNGCKLLILDVSSAIYSFYFIRSNKILNFVLI